MDCTDTDLDELTRDIRSGVIHLKYSRMLIALGNQAALDYFTVVVAPVMALVNAIIDRYGCMKVRIWVANMLPRPQATPEMTKVMMKQNRSLKKAVNALVRRRKYPVQHIASHKWFLKRVKNPDGTLDVEVDQMYYVSGTVHLNRHGLEHYYLLLARAMKLWDVSYEWSGMPVVVRRRARRKVLQPLDELRPKEGQNTKISENK